MNKTGSPDPAGRLLHIGACGGKAAKRMLFIHPMWDNETERIGKQKCTPVGYVLHGIADLLGFIGLLLLFGIVVYLAYEGIIGGFRASMWWLTAIPFGVGIASEVLYHVSWAIARKRGFEYDPEKCIASWEENGQRVTYKWKPNKSDGEKRS